MLITPLALALVVSAFLFGCGGSPSTEATPPVTAGTPHFTAAEIRKDLPLYPGATTSINLAVAKAHHIRLESTDDVTKVIAFYKEELPKNGWSIVETDQKEDEFPVVIPATKDKDLVEVIIGPDREHGDKGAGISLLLQVNQAAIYRQGQDEDQNRPQDDEPPSESPEGDARTGPPSFGRRTA